MIKLPPLEYLHECLQALPEQGILVWRNRPDYHFGNGTEDYQYRSWKIWNKRYAGTLALNHICPSHGYRVGRLDRRNYLAHRIMWFMATGEEPEQIDHVNRVRSDNRISNLRASSQALNQRNRNVRRDSVSGVRGVYYVSSTGNYQSTMRVDGKIFYLGTFQTLEAATEARRQAEITHGYHP